MKYFRKIATMTLVAATLVLSGCEPTSVEEFQQAYEEAFRASLGGTLWKCDADESFNGVTSKIHSTIRFDNESEGFYYLMSITNGDTIESGYNITYTYIKPNGDLTVFLDGSPIITMNFYINNDLDLLYLKIRNGEADRVYSLVENKPDPEINLICSEWELIENDNGRTKTTVVSFLDSIAIGIVRTEISNDNPIENEYEYNGVTYIMNGKEGTYYEDNYAYNFTIDGNKMNVSDNYGNRFTLTRRNASAPSSLTNTSWSLTLYDEYYYEDRETYWPDQLVITFNFTSNYEGYGHTEYTVPELPGIADDSHTMNFTYSYSRPKGTITYVDKAEDNFNLNFVVFSDMLVYISPNGDYGILSKITNK
ncbi:MAG: hypothetical protein K6A67_09995 [Bacteroidales bacterium]|nr:hypothetical protein [Bacteroidales bacterium]